MSNHCMFILSHIDPDMSTLLEHMRSTLDFEVIFAAQTLMLYVVVCVFVFVFWSFFVFRFSFFCNGISVYFRLMSLNFPLHQFILLCEMFATGQLANTNNQSRNINPLVSYSIWKKKNLTQMLWIRHWTSNK